MSASQPRVFVVLAGERADITILNAFASHCGAVAWISATHPDFSRFDSTEGPFWRRGREPYELTIDEIEVLP